MLCDFKFSVISVVAICLLGHSYVYGSMKDEDNFFRSASSSASSVPNFEEQRNKYPSIFVAVNSGNLDAIKAELKKGVPVDALDADMYTPLMRAAFAGNEAVVKLLLENGANPTMFRGGVPNPDTGRGMKAIHSAVNGGALNTLKLIVEDLRKKGKNKEISLEDGNGQNIFDKANIIHEDLAREVMEKQNFLVNNKKFVDDKKGHIEKAQSFLARGMNKEANEKKISDLNAQIADLTSKKQDAEKALLGLEQREKKMRAIYDYIKSLPEFKGHVATSFYNP